MRQGTVGQARPRAGIAKTIRLRLCILAAMVERLPNATEETLCTNQSP